MGCNLSLLQLCLLREFTALFYGTELMIVALLCSYFFGQAVGFLTNRWLAERFLTVSFLWASLPLSILLMARLAIGALKGAGQEDAAMGLAFLLLCSFAAVYSAVLAHTVSITARTPAAFSKAYSAELLGSLFGLGTLVALGSFRWLSLTVVYPAILWLLVFRSPTSKGLRSAVIFLTLASSVLFVRYDHLTAERFYQISFDGPEKGRLLYREDSALQKVDVIEDHQGARYLFLNGVEYFSPGALADFNYYLAELPARALGSRKVLIIGSGSMSSAGRLSGFAEEVTNVEIDPIVVKVSRRYFSELHPSPTFAWRIIESDARVFLRQTEEKFDLIVLDVPTSFTLQTGSLFTQDFFELARTALTPQGAMAIYLSQRLLPGQREPVAGPILAAFMRVFPDLTVVVAHDAVNSFAYGALDQPDLYQNIDRVLTASGRLSQDLLDAPRCRREIVGVKPATLRNLRHVWEHQ